MAGSRLERFSPLFSRVHGLIRSGAVAPSEAPIWYDVYRHFPPVEPPRFDRPLPDQTVRPVLYAEDTERQKLFSAGATSGEMHSLFRLAAASTDRGRGSSGGVSARAKRFTQHLAIVARLRPDLSEAEQQRIAVQLCEEEEGKTASAVEVQQQQHQNQRSTARGH